MHWKSLTIRPSLVGHHSKSSSMKGIAATALPLTVVKAIFKTLLLFSSLLLKAKLNTKLNKLFFLFLQKYSLFFQKFGS